MKWIDLQKELNHRSGRTPASHAHIPLPTSPLSAKAPHLLIVEDNLDMVRYLDCLLKPQYHLTIVGNGKAVFKRLANHLIDLVISDVMMEEGYTLCRQLKSREATAHLPVILLTRRADRQSLYRGLKEGADAVLTKPFDEEELQLRIRQLIALRRILEQKYRKRALQVLVDQHRIAPTDQQLLEQLQDGILQHLGDRSLSVRDMARLTSKSTTAFNKWLQALTGLSPSEFLRTLRLEMAHELILNTRDTIEAIAVHTGFTDGSYLSKKYKEKYGLTPSRARNTRKS